uniref:Uncharacterized protein n=1 Tax=Pipistrellus kuhlii TaxID=59472 RepID=A0A7J7VN72_PIPKU|nr:hypothetical protein mPipKuh1_008401 [Pipistrellus kuhlii]
MILMLQPYSELINPPPYHPTLNMKGKFPMFPFFTHLLIPLSLFSPILFIFKKYVSIDSRERKRGRDRNINDERGSSIGCLLHTPLLRIKPTTCACAPIGNQTMTSWCIGPCSTTEHHWPGFLWYSLQPYSFQVKMSKWEHEELQVMERRKDNLRPPNTSPGPRQELPHPELGWEAFRKPIRTPIGNVATTDNIDIHLMLRLTAHVTFTAFCSI